MHGLHTGQHAEVWRRMIRCGGRLAIAWLANASQTTHATVDIRSRRRCGVSTTDYIQRPTNRGVHPPKPIVHIAYSHGRRLRGERPPNLMGGRPMHPSPNIFRSNVIDAWQSINWIKKGVTKECFVLKQFFGKTRVVVAPWLRRWLSTGGSWVRLSI